MSAPEEFVKQKAMGYARLLLAIAPAAALFPANLSGMSAALFLRRDVSIGLPNEPIIFAVISAALLALTQLLIVVIQRPLKKVESIVPVTTATLRVLCVVSFLLGIWLGYGV